MASKNELIKAFSSAKAPYRKALGLLRSAAAPHSDTPKKNFSIKDEKIKLKKILIEQNKITEEENQKREIYIAKLQKQAREDKKKRARIAASSAIMLGQQRSPFLRQQTYDPDGIDRYNIPPPSTPPPEFLPPPLPPPPPAARIRPVIEQEMGKSEETEEEEQKREQRNKQHAEFVRMLREDEKELQSYDKDFNMSPKELKIAAAAAAKNIKGANRHKVAECLKMGREWFSSAGKEFMGVCKKASDGNLFVGGKRKTRKRRRVRRKKTKRRTRRQKIKRRKTKKRKQKKTRRKRRKTRKK